MPRAKEEADPKHEKKAAAKTKAWLLSETWSPAIRLLQYPALSFVRQGGPVLTPETAKWRLLLVCF